jgi:hypothetical protein
MGSGTNPPHPDPLPLANGEREEMGSAGKWAFPALWV